MNTNEPISPSVDRLDGWLNLVTQLGTVRDPKTATKFAAGMRFPEPLLDALYESDGIAKKIVDAFPDHAVRRWMELEGDDDGKVADILDSLSVRDYFRDAGAESRLYGGAWIAMYINDGSDEMVSPLSLGAVRSVEALEVFDRYSATVQSVYKKGPKTGRPETIQLVRLDGSSTIAHESRLLYFDGVRATPRRRRENQGYGVSVVEHTYEAVRALGSAFGSMETILQFFEVGVIKIKDLAQAIATGQEDRIKTRAEIMNLTKSILNAIYLDADGEEYDRKSSSVSGLPDMLDRFILQASGVSNIPAKILMGQQTAGMGAKDAADIQTFYDDVGSYQRTTFNPPLMRILEVVKAARDYKIDPKSTFRPKWLSLYEPTDKEKAEARKIQAEADSIYLDKSVLTSEEVRSNRFENGYSFETEVEELGELPEPDEGGEEDETGSGDTGNGSGEE